MKQQVEKIDNFQINQTVLKYEESIIAKYGNELQKHGFKGLTEQETKLFLTIIAKVGIEKRVASFSFREIMDAMGIHRNMSFMEFNDMFKAAKKNIECRDIEYSKGHFISIYPFEVLSCDPNAFYNGSKGRIDISFSDAFYQIVRDTVINSFGITRVDQKDLITMSGIHPITLYRHLKQFDNTGYRCIKVEDVRDYFGVALDCPVKYINKYILEKSYSELLKLKRFKELKIWSELQGRETIAYHFVWKKAGFEKMNNFLAISRNNNLLKEMFVKKES